MSRSISFEKRFEYLQTGKIIGQFRAAFPTLKASQLSELLRVMRPDTTWPSKEASRSDVRNDSKRCYISNELAKRIEASVPLRRNAAIEVLLSGSALLGPTKLHEDEHKKTEIVYVPNALIAASRAHYPALRGTRALQSAIIAALEIVESTSLQEFVLHHLNECAIGTPSTAHLTARNDPLRQRYRTLPRSTLQRLATITGREGYVARRPIEAVGATRKGRITAEAEVALKTLASELQIPRTAVTQIAVDLLHAGCLRYERQLRSSAKADRIIYYNADWRGGISGDALDQLLTSLSHSIKTNGTGFLTQI
jgi:hypothetical protein